MYFCELSKEKCSTSCTEVVRDPTRTSHLDEIIIIISNALDPELSLPFTLPFSYLSCVCALATTGLVQHDIPWNIVPRIV